MAEESRAAYRQMQGWQRVWKGGVKTFTCSVGEELHHLVGAHVFLGVIRLLLVILHLQVQGGEGGRICMGKKQNIVLFL